MFECRSEFLHLQTAFLLGEDDVRRRENFDPWSQHRLDKLDEIRHLSEEDQERHFLRLSPKRRYVRKPWHSPTRKKRKKKRKDREQAGSPWIKAESSTSSSTTSKSPSPFVGAASSDGIIVAEQAASSDVGVVVDSASAVVIVDDDAEDHDDEDEEEEDDDDNEEDETIQSFTDEEVKMMASRVLKTLDDIVEEAASSTGQITTSNVKYFVQAI